MRTVLLVAAVMLIAMLGAVVAGSAAPALQGDRHDDSLGGEAPPPVAPSLVDLQDVPDGVPQSASPPRPEFHPWPQLLAQQRAAALLLPPGEGIQIAQTAGETDAADAPSPGPASFDGPDASQGCSWCLPPDGDIAVGPHFVIGTINTAFMIYSRSGTELRGPISYVNFFAGTACLESTSDPFGGYDIFYDRYMVGILSFDPDTLASTICIAVTRTGDPRATWVRYAFPVTNPSTYNLLDFPQVAIWHDGIYLAGNRFSCSNCFSGVRVYAYNKEQMYNAQAASYLYKDIGSDYYTLHPALRLGYTPAVAPEYFLAADFCGNTTCNQIHLFRWNYPFSTNTWVHAGSVTVTAYAQPPNALQGGGGTLESNDFRNLDAQYYNGTVYGAHAIGCNPGSGTVDCLQWYQLGNIDGTPALAQQGIYASSSGYRLFPDLTVDRAGNMFIEYVYSASNVYAGIRYTGRLATDPLGTLQSEASMRNGGANAPGSRWGDYGGMVIDPVDGCTAWGLLEYAKNGYMWGSWIGTARFSACVAYTPTPTPTGTPPTRTPTPTYTPTASTCDQATPINENFESGTLGSLVAMEGTAVPHWTNTTSAAFGGTHAAFAQDVAEAASQSLRNVNSFAIPAGASRATLSFWHRYSFETNRDGGVLEIGLWSNVATTPWNDAQDFFAAGGYNGTIATGYNNPLTGRHAWTGTTNGAWTHVLVDLLPMAGQGTVWFRFRAGTDDSTAASGWWIDDVKVAVEEGSCSHVLYRVYFPVELDNAGH